MCQSNLDETPNVDKMDIAYLAIGAWQAWTAAPVELQQISDGESTYITTVLEAAPTVARLRAEHAGFDGDWNYDVSEPLGEAIGKAVLNGTSYSAEVIARALLGAVVDCGHSGCRQHWIETGATACVQ